MAQLRLLASILLLTVPAVPWAATDSVPDNQPRLEHIAVWVKDLEKTSTFLTDVLGWRRHPLEFGVAEQYKEFGGMKLAFVDANGLWLELVEPTTPGPGMDLLNEKGKGSLVELDFGVDDFDKKMASLKEKGIDVIGMDGKSLQNGGLLVEWAIKDGKRVKGEERLMYLPLDVSRGTAIELFSEYPTGVVLLRDAMWKEEKEKPVTSPRVDHVVVLGADLEKTAQVYAGVLGLKRHPMKSGLNRDWMEMGQGPHAWIDGNRKGFWIEAIAPASPATPGVLKKFGDGALTELDAEVKDIDAFYDQLKAKGVSMTAGDSTPLPAGTKALTVKSSGDRYAYIPLDRSEGMRILIFQRGPGATSIFQHRDDTWKH